MIELPREFIQQTQKLMGEERFARYMAAFNEEPPVSIRLNPTAFPDPSKGKRERCRRMESPLSLEGAREASVPWCPLGYYLPMRPNFTFDPLLHAGCYYVQEAASMFIHHILNGGLRMKNEVFFTIHSSLKLLDLCAAPGGKSTCAIAALPEGSELWSNDPVHSRASILSENIQKWGYPNCHVTNNYPHDYVRSGMLFDIILCDVPCSGEGMFRKDPATIGEWSPQNVEKCWQLQRDIVSEAWQCLKPGGILIYSTCTFNTKENEENVRWIAETFDADIVPVETLPEWNITDSLLPGFDAPVYRFIPGITRSEGLFVCVLRKSGEWKEEKGKKNTIRQTQGLHILPPFTPTPSLHEVDLDYAPAIAYLRGEAIVLPQSTPHGIITVSFMGYPLGQVKNIGTRANNLYPKEWRIKSTHIPKEYEAILRLT